MGTADSTCASETLRSHGARAFSGSRHPCDGDKPHVTRSRRLQDVSLCGLPAASTQRQSETLRRSRFNWVGARRHTDVPSSGAEHCAETGRQDKEASSLTPSLSRSAFNWARSGVRSPETRRVVGGFGGGSVVGRTTSAPEASLFLLFSETRQQTVVRRGGVPPLSGAALPEDAGDVGSRVLLAAASEHGQAGAYHSGPVLFTPKVCARKRSEPPI